MEDSLVNRLPEDDALPDGFCGSSENTDMTSLVSELARNSVQEGSTESFDTSSQEGTANSILDNKAEKSRTFPVQLSVNDVQNVDDNPTKILDNISEGTTNSCLYEDSTLSEDFCKDDISRATDSAFCDVTVVSPIDTHATSSGSITPIHKTEKKTQPKTSKEKDKQNAASDSQRELSSTSAPDLKGKQNKGISKIEKELAFSHQKFLEVALERDNALLEVKKNTVIREKLESLCRELQRQNKMLKDECKKISEEGNEKRLELSNKFNDVIKEVSTKLEAQKDEQLSQFKENEMLREKLKQFAEQYDVCEQQFLQQLKKKALELQISEVKLQQQQEVTSQERTKTQGYAEEIKKLVETEKNLRLQLSADGEKFQQFQETLSKSNEVFESFKKEMEKMAKAIKDLNKENNFLKSKCEKTDISLIELVDEREKLKKQLEKTRTQKEKLESLCRKLQSERKQNINVTQAESEVTAAIDHPLEMVEDKR